MHLDINFRSPLLAPGPFDNFFSPLLNPFDNSTFTHFFSNPYKKSHRVTFFYLVPSSDSSFSNPLQKTSLKVHETRFTWLADTFSSSPRELDDCLKLLEKKTCCSKGIEDIKEARSVVSQASDVFEQIRDFKKDLLKLKSKWSKESSEAANEQLSKIKKVWAEVLKINLPNELTQENVNVYANKAVEVLNDCGKIIGLKETASEKAANQDAKTTEEVPQTSNEKNKNEEPLVNNAKDASVNAEVESAVGPLDAKTA